MLSEGIQTGRGRRGAYLHRDRVNGVLRGRRGARLAALTSGGAIPDTADYRVLADPDDTFVGTVNEDWAIESMAGDIFLLGTTSWRIRRVEAGVVRVSDAEGLPPTIPFWLGEAPARTEELSAEVSSLRAAVEARLARDDLRGRARLAGGRVRDLAARGRAGAALPRGLAHGARRAADAQRLVVERFFDETGGMQLVVHAPLRRPREPRARARGAQAHLPRLRFRAAGGGQRRRARALARPAALLPARGLHEDALGAHACAEALAQAVLVSPMFTARWRWNLGRSLAVLRMRGGKRNPPPIQRMEADDLMAAVFPGLAQCQENQAGPIEIPDHPLVRQTLHDCLHEAMDVDALGELLGAVESGGVQPAPARDHRAFAARARDPERPAVHLPRRRAARGAPHARGGAAPRPSRDGARSGPPRSRGDREGARGSAPAPRDAEELHDTLLTLVVVAPRAEWGDFFESLVRDGRAARVATGAGVLWCATEQRAAAEASFPDARFQPDVALPAALAARGPAEPDQAAAAVVRGHLDTSGPLTVAALSDATRLSPARVEQAIARLEAEGFALRGSFSQEAAGAEEVCARRLLARIHLYTHERLRREIEPVTAQDFLRFLLRWQHVAPGTQREGRRGVLSVVEQLQGFELAAGSWEDEVLPARVGGYRREWLDALCLSGDVIWARLGLRAPGLAARSRCSPPSAAGRCPPAPRRSPSRCARSCRGCWRPRAARASRRFPVTEPPGICWRRCVRAGRSSTASWWPPPGACRSRSSRGSGIWSRADWSRRTASNRCGPCSASRERERRGRRHERLRRGSRGRTGAEGRWALLPPPDLARDPDERAQAVAEQLLARWGVLFRDLLARETLAVSWREILWALRRLEARGAIRGGRFVTGFVGEQYALPGAVEALRRTRKLERTRRDGAPLRRRSAESRRRAHARAAHPGRAHPAGGLPRRPSAARCARGFRGRARGFGMSFLQDPPRLGNQWREDRALRRLLTRRLPADVLAAVTPSLDAMGELAAGELLALSHESRGVLPEWIPFDAWGRHVDEIRVNAAWRRCRERGRAVGPDRDGVRARARRALAPAPVRAGVSVRALQPGLHLPARDERRRRAHARNAGEPRAAGRRAAPPARARSRARLDQRPVDDGAHRRLGRRALGDGGEAAAPMAGACTGSSGSPRR